MTFGRTEQIASRQKGGFFIANWQLSNANFSKSAIGNWQSAIGNRK